MKKATKLFSIIALAAAIGFSVLGCSMPGPSDDPVPTMGSISGKAQFANSDSHAGITVTLEKTDGVRSLSAVSAARSIEQGARSISSVRALAGSFTTGNDGLFTFSDLESGYYTVYALSENSKEQSVRINVSLASGQDIDDIILSMTAVGSITGQIKVDNADTGNFGFLVSVTGTSYMAMTDDAGNFTIGDIPIGNDYNIIITKGNYTTFWANASTTITVTVGVPTALGVKNIAADDLLADSDITIGENGNWFVNGVDTGVKAQGEDGSLGEKPSYTVTFYVNDITSGTAPAAQTVSNGYTITLPGESGFTRTGYTFAGWNTLEDGTGITLGAGTFLTVTGNVDLYAQWDIINSFVVPGQTLATQLAWLQTNALSDVEYIIIVNANENTGPTTLSYSDRDNITIILRGTGATRTISLSSDGSMFTVGSGVTLVLDNNITLRGRSDNRRTLIYVNSGGSLLMKAGAKITGNTTTSDDGGGVHVYGGTFTMEGGEISGNTASYSYNSGGGGVYVSDTGTFTMTGGEISGNTTTAAYSSYYSNGGGGVYNSGTFMMEGGKMSGNTSYSSGNGVYNSGTFTMTGGEISGHTRDNGSDCGGVYNNNSSITFTMEGGEISGNISSNRGGGVFNLRGTFTMKSGKISGNSSATGGGVENGLGTFTMAGGEISGNTSYYSSYGGGGGVYTYDGSTFTKSGGTIYGYDATNAGNSLWNKVVDSSGSIVNNRGHAVYVDSDYGNYQRRETTAGPMVNLNSNVSGSAGGWEN